eukprot:XP_011430368.2 PREDICTED: uncharacterized protein LOC105330408 [Crassostrea gigas]
MTLTMDVILTRDVAFDNLLPTTGYVNYMETKQCDSIIQCAAVCVFCAGLLYNQNTGTCHLLKARLYETSFDRNRTDIGWGLFIHNNVCELGWHLYNDHCYIYIEMNATWVQGKDHCDSVGAYLSRIESKEESDWVSNTLLPTMDQGKR